MLKNMFGEAIEYKASEDIANKKFWEVLNSEERKPISTPQLVDLDFVRGEKLSFKIKFEVIPQLELKDYKGLTLEKPAFKVKDEDVEKEIQHILKSRASYEEAEKVTDENFRLTVDLQKLDDNGEVVEGQKSQDMVIDLSEQNVNKDIVKKSKNKKVGSKFSFSFTDNHNDVETVYNYEVEIKKIEMIVFPETNEELIKEISANKSSTLEEFKAELKDNFEKYYESQSENIFTNSLLTQIIENNEFDVPAGYQEFMLERLVDQEKENAKRYNAPTPDEKMLKVHLKEKAVWTAKWQIVQENIARIENLKIEDTDLEEKAKAEAEKTGISAEKLIKFYKDSGRGEALLEEKILNFLKDNTKIKEVDPDKDSKKTTAKKSTAKKTTKKAEEKEGEENAPAKKTTKKTTKASTTKKTKKDEE